MAAGHRAVETAPPPGLVFALINNTGVVFVEPSPRPV